jgi:YidC/Oxa1 family membrane protein insertase
MFKGLMGVIYGVISWILLKWHELWDLVLPGTGTFLATTWPWILSIVFLVVTIRVILFPVFVKQIKSQRAMQALQPKMKELQEKHKGDKEALQKAMVELYRVEKANPLMGCLPMFVQIPIFLGLFHVLKHLQPTMPEHLKTLYGWSAVEFDSAANAKLFGAPISAAFRSPASYVESLGASPTTVKIVAACLVLIMMATTFLTSRQMILKTGWNADPQQRMIQKLMLYGIPFGLLLSGWAFPIGVIVYWVTNNLFTLGQQFWVLHKYPPPVQPGATPMKVAKTAGKNGASKPVKTGIFGRTKPDTAANGAKPVIDGKALAPKPGAKPVNPKKGGAAKRQG